MIAIAELRSLSLTRLDESDSLLHNGFFDGTIYLCGYAVELALKAKICDTLKWREFPLTPNEFREYQTFRTHDLEVLLHLSSIELTLTKSYLSEWSVVSAWNPEARYRLKNTKQEAAEEMVSSARTLLNVIPLL